MGEMERLGKAGVYAVETRRAIPQEVQDNMAKFYQETKDKRMENITRWHNFKVVAPSIFT